MKLTSFRFNVTPPLGHPLCAGWYPPAKEITTPLQGNALLLHPEGALPILLCALDWAELSNEEHLLWTTRLGEAAGTTPERVAIHCIHAHDTPWPDRGAQAILDRADHPRLIMDPLWCQEAITNAVAETQEAAAIPGETVTHFRIGKARVHQLASNRRIISPEGKSLGSRRTRCPDATLREHPEGLIDPWLKTISFWNNSTKLASLHYYAIHPTSYDGTGSVSPDFVGLARNRMTDIEGVPHFYFTECAGNITAGKYNDGVTDNREAFTQKIIEAMKLAEVNARTLPLTTVEWRTTSLTLPLSQEEEPLRLSEKLKASDSSRTERSRSALSLAYRERINRPITIQALHLGEAAVILHLPSEAFIEYQLFAQSLRKEAWVAVPAYGDCGPGYIPMAHSYAEGGYEPTDAFCGPESEVALKDAIRAIL